MVPDMENVVYSFDPRAGHSSDEEIRAESRYRHLSPERRTVSWQHDDGNREMNRQVANIVATTRPLRMHA
jgi:hypothetical protein